MLSRILGPYLIGAVALALLGLSGALWWQSGRVSTLKADNAALARSVEAMAEQAEQAREAQRVADAHRQREADRAARLDASLEALLTGDFANADDVLDPRITALLDCLHGGDGSACDTGADRVAPALPDQ